MRLRSNPAFSNTHLWNLWIQTQYVFREIKQIRESCRFSVTSLWKLVAEENNQFTNVLPFQCFQWKQISTMALFTTNSRVYSGHNGVVNTMLQKTGICSGEISKGQN